ncbi:UDP-N-acetylmuramoyl-tripeptide--D-alanyl-D-alanine ligase [Marinobacter salicampi]|uniref:UDP-N-acetylmuramoyl-tripeptide--D-alanyl-D- alanine ligase n=1 Tax=Marinobacter salicampi TaxID=435907 RepID=UPI001409D8E3|nr:UDP-N-acetylmuramoyl-tripeptide--D-alanyl-D-alanine ligase [Marinobacter salicampi]
MIRPYSLKEAAQWLDAKPAARDVIFTGISTDTRSLQPGDLFVALRGENFDGHQFVAAATKAGAAGAVVDHPQADVALPQIQVADTTRALARLALANRQQSSAKVVAVTGSSGKTTVKEMLAQVLSHQGRTLATEGNLNNHIGAPLTLFRLLPEHRYAVIELGASGLGEIAHTVSITRPDVAVLTNAGEAHLEGFGSYENIVQAKGEIIDGVSERGSVVLNADDPAFEIWRRRAGQRRVVAISRNRQTQADYHAGQQRVATGGQEFVVTGPDGWRCDIKLRLIGDHNMTNALLTIAALRELGVPDSSLIPGLTEVEPVKGRLQPVTLGPGIELVDDSYNANPSAMKAALEVLSTRAGKRIAVLGAMAELGAESERMHQEVGSWARDLGIEQLVTVGPGCEGYKKGFGDRTSVCADHGEAVDLIIKQLDPPMTVLVKGSRSSAMDRVVDGIKDRVKN